MNFTSAVTVCCGSGGGTRLESVGEDDELFMDGGGVEVAAKPLAGRRKHSLPQQLYAAGVRQVSERLTAKYL